MKCLNCGKFDTLKVTDSVSNGEKVVRKRVCVDCGAVFYSGERLCEDSESARTELNQLRNSHRLKKVVNAPKKDKKNVIVRYDFCTLQVIGREKVPELVKELEKYGISIEKTSLGVQGPLILETPNVKVRFVNEKWNWKTDRGHRYDAAFGFGRTIARYLTRNPEIEWYDDGLLNYILKEEGYDGAAVTEVSGE